MKTVRSTRGTPKAASHAKKKAPKKVQRTAKARPLKPGALPQGREEERRGHGLPNDPRTMGPSGSDDAVLGSPLGREERAQYGVDDV